MSSQKILVVEDDPDIAFLLGRVFAKEGFQTEKLYSGSGLIEHVQRFQPDLVILDLMLPDVDGYTLCQSVKNSNINKTPKVIILTAKSDEDDILKGFRVGADDFVTKPFQIQEVVARAKAVLRRRSSDGAKPGKDALQMGPIAIDNTRHEVLLEGKPLNLTISEYRILQLMAAQPDRVFTREQLNESISDSERSAPPSASNRNIAVHIRALRKKLGDHSSCICTLRGVGYYFQRAESEARIAQ